MERFAGSVLDARPWGALHLVVALVVVLALSTVIVGALVALGSRLPTLRRVASASPEPLVVPAVD